MRSTVVDPDDCAGASDGESDDFLARSVPGWHAAFYGVTAIVGVLVLVDDGARVADVATLAVLLGLVAAYTLLARPAMESEPPDRRGRVYLAVAYAAFVVILLRSDVGFFLLFLLFPQTFWLVEPLRRALVWIGVLCVGIAAAIWAEGGFTQSSASAGLVSAAVNFAISALMGWWITGIIDQSEQRANLIRELEETRALLAESHRREGMLAERERLSHEIHDTLAQGFTSILMLAQAAERSLAEPEVSRERLRMIEDTARDNLAEARALVAALAPVDLEKASLAEALERIVTRFGEELDVRTAYEVAGGSRPLAPQEEVVLLRAAQEALANVRKHAGARSVDVRLAYGETGATLVVHDDGRGFDAQDVEGFGLRGMRARVESIGGRLDVATGLGTGTRIRVEV
jgi:signal transduction histidine kinase